jgi:hypothetical protein
MAKWLEDAMQIQDPVKRTAAIAAIREALGSGEPVRVLAGLWAVEGMTQAGIDYDKASVRGLVVPQLDAADPVLRKAAMYALVSSGREPGDLDRLLRLRNDPSPVVRTEVTFIASQVARGELNGEVGAVVLAALDGVLEAEASRPREKQNSPDFRMFLARVNWRKPSPEIEDRLLALAKDPATRETVLNMVFQNMEKTPRVVDMLVELLDGPSILHQYIALRCLCYQVPESMAPRVAAILVKVLEARTADSTYWQWCLYGLRSFGTAAELPVLESLEGNEMIPEGRRKEAREAMDAIRKRQAK